MKLILTCFLIFAHHAYATTLLFGPHYPNTLACRSDAYALGNPPKVPEEIKQKVNESKQDKTYPVVENSFYKGFTNQLATSVVRLRVEYANINEDVVYPNVIPYLSLFIAKDYVRSHIALVNLNLLKMLDYTHKSLLGYANSCFNEDPNSHIVLRRYKYTNGIVYVEIAERLATLRKKKLEELESEVKRIMSNINHIPEVKATGKLWLLIDGFNSRSVILCTLAPILLFGLHNVL